MIEDENTAWLISLLENDVANQVYSKNFNYTRRYPVEMRDISIGGYRERSDEALTRIYTVQIQRA